MLRVAVISGLPPNHAGESNYCYKLFEKFIEIKQNETELLFIAHFLADGQTEILSNESWRIRRITGKHGIFKTSINVISEVLKFKPDIVHLQGVHTGLYGFLVGEPFILLVIFFRILGIKVVHTIHSTWLDRHLDEMFMSKQYNKVWAKLGKIYFKVIYHIICRVPSVVRVLVAGENSNMHLEFSKYYKINKRKVQVEIHPCDIARIDLDKQESLKLKYGLDGSFVFLATGFVRRDKGYHLLLEAFEKLSSLYTNARLIIAGLPQGNDGELYSRELIQYVKETGLTKSVNLQFQFLDNKTYDEYFGLANAVVIPYRRAIGASGPIHQAISKGKNVIATNVDHNLGLVGLINLYDPTSKDSLFTSLVNAISEDGSGGIKLIDYTKRHSWALMAQEYFKCYKDLLTR